MRVIALLGLIAVLASCAESPTPPPAINPYTGTRWIQAEGGDAAPTIEFADSRASGFAGCNRWFSQVSATRTALHFTAAGTTRRMCDAPAMETEQLFLATLEATASGRIEDEALVLSDEHGRDLARFRRLR